MKYCPYCGTDLAKEDAAFCMECGKQLSVKEEKPGPEQAPAPTKPKKSTQAKKKREKKSKQPKEKRKRKTEALPEVVGEPVDDGYDGYYNDVLPPDLDREKEGLDKELIKKIVALCVSVVFIIGICIVMMYVL